MTTPHPFWNVQETAQDMMKDEVICKYARNFLTGDIPIKVCVKFSCESSSVQCSEGQKNE
jgi:hypothetical protein